MCLSNINISAWTKLADGCISGESVIANLCIVGHNLFRNNPVKLLERHKSPPSSSNLQELVKSLYPQGGKVLHRFGNNKKFELP